MNNRYAFPAITSPTRASGTAARLPLVALVLLGAMAMGCGGSKAAAGNTPAAGGEGASAKALVDKKCTTCHSIDKVTAVRGDAAKWTTEVDAMVGKGLKVSDKEKGEIIAFLAKEQGPEQANATKVE